MQATKDGTFKRRLRVVSLEKRSKRKVINYCFISGSIAGNNCKAYTQFISYDLW